MKFFPSNTRLAAATGFLLCLCACGAVLANTGPADAVPANAEARESEQPILERMVFSMGTMASLRIWGQDRSAALLASEQALLALEATEARLSTWRADTDLARLNAAAVGETLQLSEATIADLGRARELAQLTGSAFDPGVGGLVAAWDLRGPGRIPGDSEIGALLEGGGIEQLRLQAGGATRTDAGLWLEEGGFGKGAGLERALAALREAGVTRATIDLGGQFALLSDGQPHVLSIADPRDRQRPVLSLELQAGSLATSGNSERGRSLGDGARGAGLQGEHWLGHILDPRSGYPAHRGAGLTARRWARASVSVWAPEALDADALATALFVMGPVEGLAWAEGKRGIEAVFLIPQEPEQPTSPLDAHATSGFRGLLQTVTENVTLQFATTTPGS